MPKPGDRIIIDGTKLGQSAREGDVLETIGSLIKIRWADGSESLLTPAAGTLRVLTGSKAGAAARKRNGAKKAAAKKPAKKAAAKKTAAKAKKKPAPAKKAAAKKPKAKAKKKK